MDRRALREKRLSYMASVMRAGITELVREPSAFSTDEDNGCSKKVERLGEEIRIHPSSGHDTYQVRSLLDREVLRLVSALERTR